MPRLSAHLVQWLSLLLVWAGLSYAAHAVVNSGPASSGPRSSASVATYRSVPEAVATGQSGQDVGRACSSLFGSYDGWLFSQNRQGLCGLYPHTTADSPP